MHDDDLWQVYADNGAPISGKGASGDAFDADKSLNMAMLTFGSGRKIQMGRLKLCFKSVAQLKSGRVGSIFLLAAM
jgi:hypothetical protein